jgi:hypothetical protein
MKKTILLSWLIGGSVTLWAQDSLQRAATDSMKMTTTDTSQAMNTTTYNAYATTTANVPSSVQNTFMKEYPTAGNTTWQQTADGYKATYTTGGRNMHVYYGRNNASYAVALPVLQTYVPEEVVAKAISNYPNDLYAITMVKGLDSQDVYGITLLNSGGETKMEWMAMDGSPILNVFRTDTDSMMMNQPQTMPSATDTSHMNMNMTDTTSVTSDTMHHNMNTMDSTMHRDSLNAPQMNDEGSQNNNNSAPLNNQAPDATNSSSPAITPNNSDSTNKKTPNK